jgi:ABC-type bacteriocin/lantibiotic exporter with double-glycine peptidase domain
MYREDGRGAGGHEDPGAVARALELALEGLEGHCASGASHAIAAGAGALGGLDGLAEALEEHGLVARVRRLPPSGLRRAVLGGPRALARVGGDWLVVNGHRATVVGAGTESTIPNTRRGLRRLGVDRDVDAILLEPRLVLDVLAADHGASKSPWARLRGLVSLEAAELASLVVYAVVIGGLSLAVPIAAQVLVNTIAFGSLLQPLVVLAALLFGVLAFSGLVQVVQWYAVEVLQRRIFVRVAEDLSRRLAAISAVVRERHDPRELANRFFEVLTLQKTVSRLLLDGLGLALQTMVGLLLLAFYHPVLLAFDVVLVAALVVVMIFGLRAVPTAIEESKAKYRVAAWLETVAASPTAFKRADAATFAAIRTDALTRGYLAARRRHYLRVLRQLVGGVGVQIFAMVALLGLGGWLVIRGELTLGQLVAAELVVGVIGAGFAKVGKHLEAVYDLLAGLDKVGKVLDAPIDSVRRVRAGRRVTRMHVRGLVARPGLAPVSFALEPGARVWVDGPAAGGKSALLETLAGLRAPHEGSISVPDADDVAGSLRERALLIRSDDVLAEGTVLDNLRVADPRVDEDRAREVLRMVGLEDAISRLEGGLDARVLGTSGPLSSSECARLVLARAVLARPDVLIVDGVLDDLGLERPMSSRVLDVVMGPDAPWTVIATSRDPQVRERCALAVQTRREDSP